MNQNEFLVIEQKEDDDTYTSKLVSEKSFLELLSKINNYVNEYIVDINPLSTLNGDVNKIEKLKESLHRHVTSGSIASNVVEDFNKSKVLFIPRWVETEHSNLFVDPNIDNRMSKSNVGGMMTPIVAKWFDTSTDYYVSLPQAGSIEENTLWRHLYNRFGVIEYKSNKQYALNVNDWQITDRRYTDAPFKFDLIFLQGIDAGGNTYSASDVKDDFANYGADGFQVLDYYENHDLRLKLHEGKTVEEALAEGVSIPTRISGTSVDFTKVLEFSNTNSIPQTHHNNEKFKAIINKVLPAQQAAFKAY